MIIKITCIQINITLPILGMNQGMMSLKVSVRRQNLLDTFAFELREYFDVSFCYSFYAN